MEGQVLLQVKPSNCEMEAVGDEENGQGCPMRVVKSINCPAPCRQTDRSHSVAFSDFPHTSRSMLKDYWHHFSLAPPAVRLSQISASLTFSVISSTMPSSLLVLLIVSARF